jgi:signal peptidase I
MDNASMEPTVHKNQVVMANRVPTFFSCPHQRGEIILFFTPSVELPGNPENRGGRFSVKRIIGLPGDRIEIKPRLGLFINGEIVDESSYAKTLPHFSLLTLGDICLTPSEGAAFYLFGKDNNLPVLVPKGKMFVLGDNRDVSVDSRQYGFVEQTSVVGPAIGLPIFRPNFD